MIPSERRLAEIARRNDNVFTRSDVLGAGLPDEYIDERLAHYQWQRVQDGVYLIGAAKPTWRQRGRAAILAAGPEAMVSHRTAAALEGLDGALEGVIEITVPRHCGPAPRGVIVHRSRRAMGKPRRIDGIPVTSMERTLVDYAAVVPDVLVERAVESALLKRRATEAKLWWALAEASGPSGRATPGVSRLRRVMAARPEGKPARSFLELLVLGVLRKYGVMLPTRNHTVWADGVAIGEIDLAWVYAMVALEADGAKFHSTTRQRRLDKARQAKLEALGWLFIRVTWADVVFRPESIVAQVLAALSSRQAA